jgi:HAD superfamily hydrolase (TIGR01509 family)
MRVTTIFLDDGGVMNDNRLRGPQWQRLVGEFFPPLLGGAPEAWGAANFTVMSRLIDPDVWHPMLNAAPDYHAFICDYDLAWLGGMCRLVGVAVPPDDEAIALARQCAEYATRWVRSAYPGAVEAIRALHASGYVLHTASGGHSGELAGYLEGMGVRACFGRLYGADLVNAAKTSPLYYERVFADAEVDPATVLVVDDKAEILAYAAEVGAKTVLVGGAGVAAGGAMQHVSALADLPALIDNLT